MLEHPNKSRLAYIITYTGTQNQIKTRNDSFKQTSFIIK